MAESLMVHKMTTRLIVRENIISNQHTEHFRFYVGFM